jgi:predicted AlkP superfamily pyrophosphatase or phosphodiesterase
MKAGKNCPARNRPAILAILLALAAPLPADPGLEAAAANDPGQRDKPYLVLVSIDGFRWDFADRYQAEHIASIGARGLHAQALQPAFPTLTFPNHFSIATGLPPAQHGLVANEFPDEEREHWYFYKDRATVQDGDWYLAEPIWVTAERAGMRTAAFYFVGTEADVGGVRPTHWKAFDPDVGGDVRVQQVLDWLAEPVETRPHLITLYFEEVDDTTHWYGVDSPQSLAAIRRVDGLVGQLLDGIRALAHGNEIYVFLVSDHGVAAYEPRQEPLVLDRIVDLTGVRVVEGGPFAWLYFEAADRDGPAAARDAINAQWDCGRAMLPAEAPAAWAVSTSRRFPDLIVQANPGCAVISTSTKRDKINAGDHGWAPETPDMRGAFYALGPRIRPGTRPGVMQITDVYPLMLAVLELTPPGPVESYPGLLSVALPALQPPVSTH